MLDVLEDITGGGNRRFRLGLGDGGSVEAVMYGGESLCVSSQVGCAVSCPFCASGARGFGRNLSFDELVAQVEVVRAQGETVRRVTVSGIGEPLHNHASVVAFSQWARQQGLGMSLTTSGGPLARLTEWLETLAHRGVTISIHAGTEATRARVVPRGPALAPLFGQLRQVLPTISSARRRKVALAYLVVSDLNDHDDDITGFIELARPLQVKLHLYAYNPVPTNSLESVSEVRYQAIAARLRNEGFDIRRSSQARRQANGGCGTLVALRSASGTRASAGGLASSQS